MLKYILTSFLFYLFGLTNAGAHSPSETHTTFQIQDGQLHLHIELPWSIERAVRASNPGLAQKIFSKAEFERLVKDYVLSNLIISQFGHALNPSEVKGVASGHSHSLGLQLIFQPESLENLRIENKLMFNVFEKQKNYNRVIFQDGSESLFITNLRSSSFSVPLGTMSAVGSEKSLEWMLLIGLAVFLAVSVAGIRKRSFKISAT